MIVERFLNKVMKLLPLITVNIINVLRYILTLSLSKGTFQMLGGYREEAEKIDSVFLSVAEALVDLISSPDSVNCADFCSGLNLLEALRIHERYS